MKQFFANKYVQGITQYIKDEHFGPRDYIDWYCEQMGLSREEYMAGYRIAIDLRLAENKKPGPDPYQTGLDDEDVEDKEDQIKKQAEMDDDDPDAYKEMPGDKEAREKGKVKTSEFTKKYHELYGDDESNEAIAEGKMPDKYIGNDEIVFLKTKEDSRGANYNLYYKGHDIEAGGVRFGSEKELKDFAANYILSNQWYNKLRYADAKPLPESLNEEKAEGERGPIDNPDIEKALKTKAEETGVPIELLRIIMRRGMAAWKSGHRPGAGQEQWGYARVNAFLTKGEGTWGDADKDVAKEVRDGGHDKNLKKG